MDRLFAFLIALLLATIAVAIHSEGLSLLMNVAGRHHRQK
jgi:hypothetical protein